MNSRNQTLDSLKLVAVLFVIAIHTFPFYFMEDSRLATLGMVINQVSRFAVPSFFVISGYLYTKHFNFEQPSSRLFRTTKRLLTLYVFWCLFYLIPYDISLIPGNGLSAPWEFSHWHFDTWTQNWENFLFGGSKAQLWFLPALLCAATISTPFIASRRTGGLLFIGLFLFIIALLSGPYKETPVGFDLGFYTRNGPFLSTIFFAGGVYLAQNIYGHRKMLRVGYSLTALGLLWHLSEFFWLKHHYETYFIYDFNAGTLTFGIGAAVLGIHGARPLQAQWLIRNGKYSLGIYLLHMFVLDFMIPISRMLSNNLLWNIALPMLTIILTLWLVKFSMRYPLLRKVLS